MKIYNEKNVVDVFTPQKPLKCNAQILKKINLNKNCRHIVNLIQKRSFKASENIKFNVAWETIILTLIIVLSRDFLRIMIIILFCFIDTQWIVNVLHMKNRYYVMTFNYIWIKGIKESFKSQKVTIFCCKFVAQKKFAFKRRRTSQSHTFPTLTGKHSDDSSPFKSSS